jgi:hypothetical protein
MTTLSNLRFAPGLFTETTDRGADGRWRDGNLVRWNNNQPETVGGWVERPLTGPDLVGIPRATVGWTTLDGVNVAAVGTNRKLYIIEGGRIHNITPLRLSVTLADPITTVSGSAVVAIAHTAHGAAQGDSVFFSNATPVGGLTLSGEYLITSIVSADSYTVTAATAASSSSTGGGSVGIDYEITVGGAASGLAFGWGSGSWGEGTWGTPRESSTLIIPLRVWSLDNWGEDLIASPSGGSVYWWDRTLGFGTRAQLVPQAPLKNLRVLVSQENRQLICLGSTDEFGELDALLIRWSDNEDFTTFEILPENNAGSQRIDGGGSEIISGVRTRSGIVLWTDRSAHLMQPTGDSLVYEFRQLGSGVAIAGPNAALDVNGVVFAFGVDNFYAYDGVLQVLPCDVWTKVFPNLNVAQRRMVYTSLNTKFSEIWWFYPEAGVNSSNKLVVYNYRDRMWWYGDMQRASFADFSRLYEKPYGFDDDGVLYTHEDGQSANGEAINRFIVSDDIELGDGQSAMHVSALIPDFKELVGTATITLKGRIFPAAVERTNGPHNVTSSTRKVSTRLRARQVSITIGINSEEGRFRMGEWRAEVREDGER